MMDTTGAARRSVVPAIVGMILLAAGAADGLDLVVSGREAAWPLVIRADFELLGGFWLLSGGSSRRARIAAIAAWGAILVYDLARAAAGYPPRDAFGRIVAGHWCVLFIDVSVLAGLLLWRPGSERPELRGSHARRLVPGLIVAVALGLAIEWSQVGQFPIVATVRAGRSSSGLDYLVYLPDGYYRSRGRWPMILTLHGRGEAGDDVGLVRSQGLPRRVEEKGGLPFVIVAPQSPGWGWDVGALNTLLDEALRRYRVDPDRVYLAGNSMGGTGTWLLAAHSPGRFAAIAPICGGADPVTAGRLRDVPTWAFHGAEDHIVPLEQSERMIEALKAVGGEARLTVYPGVGHDAWTPTYADPRFYEWLLRHRRGVIDLEVSRRIGSPIQIHPGELSTDPTQVPEIDRVVPAGDGQAGRVGAEAHPGDR